MLRLDLPSGRAIQVVRDADAAAMRALLRPLVPWAPTPHSPAPHAAAPQASPPPTQQPMQPTPQPQSEPSLRPSREASLLPSHQREAPQQRPEVGSSGEIRGAQSAFSVPNANQGAFGGERVGLPAHASRQPGAAVGPAQKAMVDSISLEEVRDQLGDGALQRMIAAKRLDDGNGRVNADIRADAPYAATPVPQCQ